MKRICVAIACLLGVLATGTAGAQNYPNQPVRIVVPFAAGGAVDSVARIVGQKMSDSLGQPVVMEVHHVTGIWNYMLKVRVKNTRMLEGLLAKVVKSVPGVERTETIIVLSSNKETAEIPTREPEWMEK